jgi:hypothetical protein
VHDQLLELTTTYNVVGSHGLDVKLEVSLLPEAAVLLLLGREMDVFEERIQDHCTTIFLKCDAR